MACALPAQRVSLKQTYWDMFGCPRTLKMAGPGMGHSVRRAKRRRYNPVACCLEVVEQPKATGLTFVRPDKTPQPWDFLIGEKSSHIAETQPGLLLANYDGPLTVVWYLAADSEVYPHPYILEGEDCQGGVGCKTMQISNGQIIRFPGLYVRQVPWRNAKRTLEKRCELLQTFLPGRAFKLKETADYHLTTLRICFHVLFVQPGMARQTHKMVLTRSLHCREPLLRRDPRILSISQCKGSVRGQEELTLEVVNISLDDMMVYFHCESTTPRTSWQAFASIVDINHNKAKLAEIVVKTPAYHDQQITTPQTVSVQIRLVDTDSTSNTVKYTYTPIIRGIPQLEKRRKQKVPIYRRHLDSLNAMHSISQAFLDACVQEVQEPSHQTGKEAAYGGRRKSKKREMVNASIQTRQKAAGGDSLVKPSAEFDYDRIDMYRKLWSGPSGLPEGIGGRDEEKDSAASRGWPEVVGTQPFAEKRQPCTESSQLSGGSLVDVLEAAVPAIVYSLPAKSEAYGQGGNSWGSADDEPISPSPISPWTTVGESSQSVDILSPDWSPESGIFSPVVSRDRQASQYLSTVNEQTSSVDSREFTLSVSTEGGEGSTHSADTGQKQGSGKEAGDDSVREHNGMRRGEESGTNCPPDRRGEGQGGQPNRDGERGGDGGRGLRPPTVTRQIDHAGGKLSLLDGQLSLTIPPGALAEGQSEDITLSVVWEEGCIPPLKPSDMNVAPVVRCLPTGLHFAQPVTLQIPHCAVKSDSCTRQMTVHCNHSKEGEKPRWERLSAGENPEVRAEEGERCFVLHVRHFTDFTITLEDGEQCQVKEMQLVAYCCKVVGLDEDQEVRIYLYDDHGSNRERIKQEEEPQRGTLVHSPVPYHVLECKRGDMEISVVHQTNSWILVSSLKKVFLFRKIWNLYSYDMCKFAWENRAKNSKFRCRIKAQQNQNDEECQLEIVNHVKAAAAPPKATVPSTYHAAASQFHMCKSVGNMHAEFQHQEYDLTLADSCRGSSVADNPVPQSLRLMGPEHAFTAKEPPPLIPHSLMQSICRKLDIEHPMGHNWMMLAERLRLGGYTRYLHDKQLKNLTFSPTNKILQLAEETQTLDSLSDLKSYLNEMHRLDVTALIDKHEQSMGSRAPLRIEPAADPMDLSSPDEVCTPPDATLYGDAGMASNNPETHCLPERGTANCPLASPNVSVTSVATAREPQATSQAAEDPFRTPGPRDCALPTGADPCAGENYGSGKDKNANVNMLPDALQRKLKL